MKASILISSHNRAGLFRRTLWAIASRPPALSFELIVVDDGSDEDILSELSKVSARIPWKFVTVDTSIFEAQTGIKKFLNNPCLTNNVAFKHSTGDFIFQQGNEVIPIGNAYQQMLDEKPTDTPHWLVMSSTYDLPKKYLDLLDKYGSNLTKGIVGMCYQWPLQSLEYRSDVTNYLSLCPRALYEKLHGYDERYFGGISAEDSDFVRRARVLPDFKQVVSPNAISLHQFHNGKTCYYDPPASLITEEKWKEGAAINRKIYDGWDATFENRQGWAWGELGVVDVKSNF